MQIHSVTGDRPEACVWRSWGWIGLVDNCLRLSSNAMFFLSSALGTDCEHVL